MESAPRQPDLSNMEPVVASVTAPSSAPPLDNGPGWNAFQRSPLPPPLNTAPDQQRQFYNRDMGPQSRILPLQPAGVAAVNSAVHSTVTDVVQEVINGSSSSNSGTSGPPNEIVATPDGFSGPAGLRAMAYNDFPDGITGSGPAVLQTSATLVTPALGTPSSGTLSNCSGYPNFGASGAGHKPGAVPDPGSSAGATKYLREDATFAIPPGTGGAANYQTVQQATSSKPQEPNLNFLYPITATDNAGNTSTDIAISAIATFTRQTLASPVSMTANVTTLVDSIGLTMPASGGPWYIRINYYYSRNGGLRAVSYATDGTYLFAGAQTAIDNNQSALYASGLSPVTYANSASVTISVHAQDNGNSTVETSTFGFGSVAIPGYLDIEIIPAA